MVHAWCTLRLCALHPWYAGWIYSAVNDSHGYSMSRVCSWNELGMSYVPVSSSPFCTRPFWRMPSAASHNNRPHLRDELKSLRFFFAFAFVIQQTLRAQRLKKFKITLRDWKFQSRLKFTSEPPSKPLLFVGNSEGPRLKISCEIEIFNRDWKFQSRMKFFSIFGPLGERKS